MPLTALRFTIRAPDVAADGDEPPVLLGSNAGPNAVELVLQALAFCYAVGFVANAAARGIEITRMNNEVEGDVAPVTRPRGCDCRSGWSRPCGPRRRVRSPP